MTAKNYESTVMRIAGNLLSGTFNMPDLHKIAANRMAISAEVTAAVLIASAIVNEVQRPEPSPPSGEPR